MDFQKTPQKNNRLPWLRKISIFWNDLPIKTKITTLLMICAIIPGFTVTQGLVKVAKDESIQDLQRLLEVDLVTLEDAIDAQKKQMESTAKILALAVETAEINPGRINQDSNETQKIQRLIKETHLSQPNASFYIITDAEGKTIAQFVQKVKGDLTKYPLLIQEKTTQPQFEPIQLPPGIVLTDVPIVESTRNNSLPLSGVELLKFDIMERLGLAEQAKIGLRPQTIEGLEEEQQPYPKNTFDINEGKAGFVLMATQPIRLGNNDVGMAMVGTLLNRNFEIVDRLQELTGVATATIFAQDWRVSTNVPYTDKETRAIGTRVSREVANKVLNEQEKFLGQANIIGIEYLTGYSPMYDHFKLINPQSAKPVGIAYVGISLQEVEQKTNKINLIGYILGGGVVLVFAIILVVIPSDTAISKELGTLSEFAGKVAKGEPGVRLEYNERKDEIGVLTRNLNEMAEKIDLNIETRQQETELQRKEKATLEQGIYQLLEDLEGALDGDLTVRANLNSMEMSTVADLFNAIIDSLNDIAIQVKESSHQVGSSLEKDKKSIQLLAKQALKEAKETSTTLKSVEEMSNSIQEVAKNANQASTLANSAYNVTQEGTNAIEETENSILSLRSTVADTAKKMKSLRDSSEKIAAVVSIIDEIALKTNLLALNASVEANRAGEQGRGFTVVAEQVAALADQSAIATKEIEQIVRGIQLDTREVAEAMELGTSQVVETTELVESTKQRLSQVLERSKNINELMQSISQATISQTETSGLVTKLMQQIALNSEERLEFSQKVSKSIETTAQVAKQLESVVAQFKVKEE